MAVSTRIEVVVVCTDDEKPDLLLSSIPDNVLTNTTIVRGTRPCSTPRLVNDAMKRVVEDRGDPWLWLIVHPDIELAGDFFGNLTHWIYQLWKTDPMYGVVGAMGVRLDNGEKVHVGHLWDRSYEAGAPLQGPCLVDTLDELCVVLRGDRKWRLDNQLSTYHLWASELCLQERMCGRRNYVLPGMYLKHLSTSEEKSPDDPYFWFNLGVLSERYRFDGQTMLTPSGCVYDNRDHSGVRLL